MRLSYPHLSIETKDIVVTIDILHKITKNNWNYISMQKIYSWFQNFYLSWYFSCHKVEFKKFYSNFEIIQSSISLNFYDLNIIVLFIDNFLYTQDVILGKLKLLCIQKFQTTSYSWYQLSLFLYKCNLVGGPIEISWKNTLSSITFFTFDR